MRLRKRARSIVAAMAMTSTVGCVPPSEIVPVAPPGLEFARPPVPEGQGAQALGEQPAAAARQAKPATAKVANSPPTPIGQSTKTASGLVYETLKEGTGPSAKSGQTVTIHYTGTLTDGQVFDSSRQANKPPFTVVIGTSQVIPGWDEGVPGMKVGERRKLTIPPELAYGAEGQGKIPANSTLIFDVELLDAK
jgi:FKBP-type peptidyl-prolyl cis-trans isomerase FkpA